MHNNLKLLSQSTALMYSDSRKERKLQFLYFFRSAPRACAVATLREKNMASLLSQVGMGVSIFSYLHYTLRVLQLILSSGI